MGDVYVNVSRLKQIAACPTKAYLNYGVQVFEEAPPGMRKVDDGSSAATTFGTAVHAGLEEYVRDWGNVEAAQSKVAEVLLEAAEEARERGDNRLADRLQYGVGGPPRECGRCEGRGCSKVKKLRCKTCDGTGWFQPSTVEGVEYGKLMVAKYAEAYPLNHVDSDFRVVEEEITMPLFDGVHLVGRLDRVIRKNGVLWHRNYKTMHSAVNLAGEMARYQQDPHEVAYWLLMKHKWKDEEVGGSYIDGLVKQKEPQFHRLIVNRTEGVEQAVTRWLVRQAQHYRKLLYMGRGGGRDNLFELHVSGALEMEPKACVNPFGGRPCEFFDMCSTKSRLYPNVLQMEGFGPREPDYCDGDGTLKVDAE